MHTHTHAYTHTGEEGTLAIARALLHNSSLQDLDLSNNRVGDCGGEAIAHALISNGTLRDLKLSNNILGTRGASAVAMALCTNSSLRCLDLSTVQLCEQTYTSLSKAVDTNKMLRTLILCQQPHQSQDSEPDTDVDQGVLTVAHVLRSKPRYHPLVLQGAQLNRFADALCLPPHGSFWSDGQIATYFRELHVRKLLAFAMGQHARLGAHSHVRHLDSDIIPLVFAAFYGIDSSWLREGMMA
jgi:hypothetical protein